MKFDFKNKKIWRVLIYLVVVFLLYYFLLPPLNINSLNMWGFLLIIYTFLLFLIYFPDKNVLLGKERPKLSKKSTIFFLVIPAVAIVITLINLFYSPLFISGSYAKRIDIIEGKKFIDEVKEVDFSKVPLLDKESTKKIGDRVMGEMTDLVSQFTVSDMYTQINYKNSIVRVTPLEYRDFIKYFNNRKSGITGYIIVDSVTGKADLIRLEKGMKYMPSALFNENLHRKLRFDYPTEMFGTERFEIDNEGKPFWIVPTLSYSGVNLKEEITGVIIFDPVTGESKKYNVGEVPTWVDNVFEASLIIEQVNDWGKYKKGFFNSIFSQKEVVMTTNGYNYLIQEDDVYLYTGITSVSTDESNLGFILTNMRTKETHFYLIPGAEEYSAMDSAEGQVQQMKYKSTFPLLINLNGKATYLVSLKDNAGLVKMYGFVDVEDYQKVIVTDANLGILKAKDNYLKNSNISTTYEEKEEVITIKKIKEAMIDGNTYYFIEDMNGNKYKVSIKINEDLLPFIEVRNKVKIKYVLLNETKEVKSISL